MTQSDLPNLLMRALPFTASAVAFFAISFLTWAQTPKRLFDSLSFALVWFIVPWGVYASLLGNGFGFTDTPPDWAFGATRIWIALASLAAIHALVPRVEAVVRYRRLKGHWPKDERVAK